MTTFQSVPRMHDADFPTRLRRAAVARYGIVALPLILYVVVAVDRLEVLPPVHNDEPWVAAPAYKLATEGVYGSDPLTGYYNAERHYLIYPPVYTLVQALVFKSLGESVIHLRLVSVLFGLLLLVGAYLVGREVHGERTGVVAVVLLLFIRLGTGTHATGMPFLDAARWARPDIGVAALGLIAFWLFERAEKSASRGGYFATGAVTGLASLTHLYGIFWLGALMAIIAARRGVRSLWSTPARVLVAGTVVSWIPWAVVLATHWADFVGQVRMTGDRFGLFDLQFYLDNVRGERLRLRYLDLRDPSGRPYLLRPGSWVSGVGVVAGTALALRRGWRRRGEGGGRSIPREVDLALVLAVQVALFALLDSAKHHFYTIAVWPLVVLVVAWVGVEAWNRRGPWVRAVMAVAFGLVLVEGVRTMLHRRAVAGSVIPYEELAAALDQHIFEEDRVMARMPYWWALRHHTFRSWVLPISLSLPAHHHMPMDYRAALEVVAPMIVVVDPTIRALTTEARKPDDPIREVPEEFWKFMEDHGATIVGRVEARGYGLFEIYRLRRSLDEGSG